MTTTNRSRVWHAQILVILVVEFSTESARGLVLPTLFPYAERMGGDLAFVGLLTALFSAGRLVSSIVLGWLSDRMSFKAIYVASAAIAILGHVLYVLPYSPRVHSKALLALSRVLVGFSAGNRSACRSNMAALTRSDQRVSFFTLLATVVFLAYALTPGLAGLFGNMDVSIDSSNFIHFNRFTAPGFLLVGLNLCTIMLIATIFDETVTRNDAPTYRPSKITSQSSHHDPFNAEKANALPGHDFVASLLLMFAFLNFSARGMLSIFETINVPLYSAVVNGTQSSPSSVFDSQISRLDAVGPILASSSSEIVSAAAHFYLLIGLLGLVSFATVHLYGGQYHRISDVSLLIFAFATLLVGNVALVILSQQLTSGSQNTNTTYALLVVGEILVWSIGSPIASAVIVPAFSKALGPRPQGTYMGLFGASASVARMTMPLLPSLLPSWESLFLMNIGICAGSVTVLARFSWTRGKAVKRAMGEM